MSGIKRNQSKLHSFFKPTPPPAASSSASPRETPSTLSNKIGSSAYLKTSDNPQILSRSSEQLNPEKAIQPPPSQATKGFSTQDSFTSSLSPLPSSSPSEILQPAVPAPFDPSTIEVKGSDDEDDSDSDDSLEDLQSLLRRHRPDNQMPMETKEFTPSTPVHSKTTRRTRFQASPLPVLPKYRFDLKSLARDAQKDDATEASLKRVKAMHSAAEDTLSDPSLQVSHVSNVAKISQHKELLESVVAEKEGGELNKVTRALNRTEAILPEFRWYFFKTKENLSPSERTPYPVKSISKEWQSDLKDPKMRYQTMVSGFAEDMIDAGKTLPDEILLWMIDEICLEPNEVLRKSYSNVLFASRVQVGRLMNDTVLKKVFQNLGATPTAIDITSNIQPVQEIIDPYGKQNWAILRSVLVLLGQNSKHLLPELRIQTLCTLLRMGVDRVVFNNVDLYDLVQKIISQICNHVPDDAWESFCAHICDAMFRAVERPTFRLHVVETLPSTSPKIHDLRRRLAMCYYFDDATYGKRHCHYVMDLNLFIARLDSPVFDTNPETDYRELAALIQLLDIAVDDARSIDLDLTDRTTEAQFDDDIEMFAKKIKDIIRSIGIPGPGFISKVEAKEVLEIVSQRISDTLRSKPKPKQTLWKATGRSAEGLAGEKDLMKKFLARKK